MIGCGAQVEGRVSSVFCSVLVKEVKVHASSGFDDFEDDPPAP